MVSYDFYGLTYGGITVPEAEWPGLAARASDRLAYYKRIYTVRGDEQAEGLAVCAMAEALYAFGQAQAGGLQGAGSVSIGSVSVSLGQSAQLDCSPAAQDAELYRRARQYLTIERWCGQ